MMTYQELMRMYKIFYGILWNFAQDFVNNMFFCQADMMTHQQLMRVYGALMWSLSRILQAPEVSRSESYKCDDDNDRSQKVRTSKHSEHRPNQNDNERGQEVRISKHYDLHCESTQWRREKQINATRGQHVRMCKSSEL